MNYEQAWKELKVEVDATIASMERVRARILKRDPYFKNEQSVGELEAYKNVLAWMSDQEKLNDGQETEGSAG